MAITQYVRLSDASTHELYARQEQLDNYADAAQQSRGNAAFPIHDEICSDDPDAEWNDYYAIDAELARRGAE